MTPSALTKAREMNYQTEKSNVFKKNFGAAKREKVRMGGKLKAMSLKDIPLETRRQEAIKPLFLTRYE
jgi:hypothetical protein